MSCSFSPGEGRDEAKRAGFEERQADVAPAGLKTIMIQYPRAAPRADRYRPFRPYTHYPILITQYPLLNTSYPILFFEESLQLLRHVIEMRGIQSRPYSYPEGFIHHDIGIGEVFYHTVFDVGIGGLLDQVAGE
jgi:hypothetical protein